MKNFLLLVLISIIYIGCNRDTPETLLEEKPDDTIIDTTKSTENSDIIGIQWNLAEINGTKFNVDSTNSRMANFTLTSDGAISGSNGCNYITGSYELIEKSSITFSSIMSTLMACEGVTYDTEFMMLLSDSIVYSFSNDTLVFVNYNNPYVGKFLK